MCSKKGRCKKCGNACSTCKTWRETGLCSGCAPRRKVNFPERACVQCGHVFKPGRPETRLCSTLCKVLAAGKKPRTLEPRPCKQCKAVFTPKKNPNAGIFCSRECNFLHKAAKPRLPKIRPCADCAGSAMPRRKRCLACTLRCDLATASPRICLLCAKPFMKKGSAKCARYCTVRCRNRARKKRESAKWRHLEKRRRFLLRSGDDINPLEVYKRDAWTCQMCNKRVLMDKSAPHPRSPTMDHIIPLSRGGTHIWSNVRCACFRCNCKRGNRIEAQGLLVFET